jgi:serine/threonine-protein kinase
MTVKDPSSVPESGSSETPGQPPETQRTSDQEAQTVIRAIERLIGSPPRISLPEESTPGAPTPLIKPGAPGDTESEIPNVGSDQYQILGEIAKGGVGVVLKAHDMDIGRDVALKVLRTDRRENVSLIQRFVEEAQIGGQLQHPGIIPVYEMGMGADDRPYFTMKLIKGRTFAALLAERKDLDTGLRKYLSIFEQICHAMAYAHSRGVIHRDLKPANIMVGAFGEVLVVDWGFAKVLQHGGVADELRAKQSQISIIETVRSRPGSSGSDSMPGSVMGTPAYMPPEQARGDIERVDERSDVFSLGAILCEIMTGAPPYGGDANSTLVSAAKAELEPASERLESCKADPDLVVLVKTCLSPSPAARFGSAGELADAIGAYLTSVEDRAREAQIHAAEARVKAEEARKERRLAIALALAVSMVVVLGAGGWFWVQKNARQQIERVNTAVEDRLDRVRELLAGARSAELGDAGPWDVALAEAEVVSGAADDDGVTAATRERVASVVGVVRTERETRLAEATAAAADRAMLLELEEIRIPTDVVQSSSSILQDVARPEEQYVRAFRAYGIDVAELETEEAAKQVQASRIPLALVIALDNWAMLLRGEAGVDPASWRRLLRIALRADPEVDPFRTQLREIFLSEGFSPEQLRTLLVDAESADLDPVTLQLLALGLEEAGDFVSQADVLRLAHARHPDDFETNLKVGLWFDMQGLDHDAARVYSAAVAIRPENGSVRFFLGDALQDLGRWEDAIATFRGALRHHPGDPAMTRAMARCLRSLGRNTEANEEFARAQSFLDARIEGMRGLIATTPESKHYVSLAQLLRQDGDAEGEVEAYREAVRLEPALPSLLNTFQNRLHALKRYEAAIEVLDRAIEITPEWAVLHKNRGVALERLGRRDESIEAYRRAVRIDPNDAEAQVFLGFELLQDEQVDAAMESFRAAFLLDPDAGVVESLIRVMREAGAETEIERVYRVALEQKADSSFLHWNYGQFLRSQGRGREALDELREGRRLLPRISPDAAAYDAFLAEVEGEYGRQKALGLTSEGEGDPLEERINSFRAMTVQRPEDAQAWSSLGRILLEEKQDATAAAEAFAKVIALEPHWGQPYYDLGRAQMLLDEPEAAAQNLERAIELRVDEVEVWFALGQMQERTGDVEGAMASYVEVLERDEEHEAALARLEALLEEG